MRLTTLLILLGFCFESHAFFQMDLLKSKNSTASTSRWTLADWLSQKSKIRLADQWLAANRSKSSFEFNPSAAHSRYTIRSQDTSGSASVTSDSQVYRLDTNISILNLTGEYEKSSLNLEEYGGAAGLRFLGDGSRSTGLVGRYGWRRRQDLTTQERWDNQYAEGQLQLYIISAFGLNGQYRHYFPSTSNLGNRLEGHKLTAGAFIELGVFRLYANYVKEPLTFKNGAAETKQSREGYDAGLKIHM